MATLRLYVTTAYLLVFTYISSLQIKNGILYFTVSGSWESAVIAIHE